MQDKSKLLLWLSELANRFSLKTPAFFQVWQTIGIVALGVGLIPEAIAALDIAVPPQWAKYLGVAVKVAGAVTWFMSKQPACNAPAVAANTDQLPFTSTKPSETDTNGAPKLYKR